MSDPHWSTPAAPLSLSQVAQLVGGRLVGDGDLRVEGIASLEEAAPTQIGFLARKRYVRFLEDSRAGSFLSATAMEGFLPAGASRVVVEDPYRALHLVLTHFVPDATWSAEVHPTAVLGCGVQLGAGVRVGPYAVLEDGVTVGAGTCIGAHTVLGADTRVGDRCRLHPHVVTYPGTVVGSGVTLHAGARIGSDGFGYTTVDGDHRKIPHGGRAVLEDDVEIGANTTIDRGSIGDTVVGRGTKIDNLVQVAHNVRIGAGSLLAALVGIAGSTRIGSGVWVGGAASAINHIEIGDGAQVAFGSTVMRDVPPGETVSGSPSRPHREELRRQAQVARLDKLSERVRKLESLVS